MSDFKLEFQEHQKNDTYEGWKLQAKDNCASCLIECTIIQQVLVSGGVINNEWLLWKVCFIYICSHSLTYSESREQIVSEAAVY